MKYTNLIFVVTGLCLLISISELPARAEDTSEIKELKEQIKTLQKRVEELETQKTEPVFPRSRQFRNHLDWDPFAEMERIQQEMNQMFQNSFSRRGSGPSGAFSSNMRFNYDEEIKETEDGYEVKFDLTGLNKDKVDIQINQYSITVKGEQSSQETEENQSGYFSSQSFGSFMKTIPLPTDADTEKVKTEKEGDTLVIKIPKKKS